MPRTTLRSILAAMALVAASSALHAAAPAPLTSPDEARTSENSSHAPSFASRSSTVGDGGKGASRVTGSWTSHV